MTWWLCDMLNKSNESIIKEKKNQCKVPTLGILRLDYNYPPSPGDIDCTETFNYPVIYRVIPGLTFKMCQSGNLTEDVKINCINAVKFLEEKNVSAITGDCGFMINIHSLVVNYTSKPVFLSSLVQLNTLVSLYNKDEMIAIFTANGKSLENIRNKFQVITKKTSIFC